MKLVLLDEKQNKYKANLHCHSTISDGCLSPEKLKEIYMEKGYSIIAYTDHDVFICHNDLTDNNFLALNGYEMEFYDSNVKEDASHPTCHICLIQKDPNNMKQICFHREKYLQWVDDEYIRQIQFDESEPNFERDHTPELISKVMKLGRENGFFVTYNHPTWSMESFNDYMNFHGMHAMEMCNYGCVVDGYDEYNPRVYDDMLRGGERIYCISTDDNHNADPIDDPHFDSFGGFTVIYADKLEYNTIIDSMFNGNFYASQGPAINSLYIEDEKIHIKTSDAKKIFLTTNGRKIRYKLAKEGEFVNEAEFTLPKINSYFRITVEDAEGKHANTNAYFLDDIMKSLEK